MLRSITETNRHFRILEHEGRGLKTLQRLVQESSAVGPYEDALENPGSSYLWIGDRHHLNRDEVEDLAVVLLYWLQHKRMPEGRPRHLPRPFSTQMPLFAPERGATRSTDPQTSRDAGAYIPAHRLSGMRLNILRLFGTFGAMTDPELRAAYLVEYPDYYAESTVRKRRSECVEMGWVEDSGNTRTLPGPGNGCKYTVWQLTPSGVNAIRRGAT